MVGIIMLAEELRRTSNCRGRRWKSGTVWSSKLMKKGSLRSRNIWVGWSSTKSGHSPALSFGASCSRNEVNAYRIRKFKLNGFVDSFISSCFVHIRKPDVEIFRLALDIAQAPVRQVVYIENTPMFVQVAQGLGIRSILHTDYKSTCAELASFGLPNEGAIHETR